MTQTTNTLNLITEFLTQGGYAPNIDADALDREAVLVSAAPDLLAALEQCLPIVDAYRRLSLGDGDLTANNARNAIAKAKGQ